MSVGAGIFGWWVSRVRVGVMIWVRKGEEREWVWVFFFYNYLVLGLKFHGAHTCNLLLEFCIKVSNWA